LSDLALPFNTIRDLSLLVDALCNCTPTLQVLDLRHNHIDHEGLTHHFASKLPHMKSFRRLWMSGNPFLDGLPAAATTLKILLENTQTSQKIGTANNFIKEGTDWSK
jgi:Leucine-rich repeat (LRR) protein